MNFLKLSLSLFQKSVVLLSHLPLVSLFTSVLDLMAPEYFDTGEASLEAACHHLDQWPLPTPGVTLSLPLLGTLIQVTCYSTLSPDVLINFLRVIIISM